MKFSCRIFLAYSVLLVSIKNAEPAPGDAYTMISRLQTDCELESLSVGTALADKYNSFIEGTEREERLKNDYLMQRLGFLTQPGSVGHTNISSSSYWALENQWVFMLGDTTQKQIWATLAAPVSPNPISGQTSEASAEKCQTQAPHRNKLTLGVIHDNVLSQQVTCELPGYGKEGRLSYDWKQFPVEDYDTWLFGDTGTWHADSSVRRPDILVLEVGQHSCLSAYDKGKNSIEEAMIKKHRDDLKPLFKSIRTAVDRHNTLTGAKTMVIISTAGRVGNSSETALDTCSWRFNRFLAHGAHTEGFTVFEREELEHRILLKSEFFKSEGTVVPSQILEKPAPQIVGSALLTLISCLKKGELPSFIERKSSSLQKKKSKDFI